MIQVKQLNMAYGDHIVIDDLTMALEPERITCLLAPSGAGKSTLLRILAGLQDPQSGEVLIDGQRGVQRLGQMALVFQEDCVFPHLSVRDNLNFGLRLAANAHRAEHGESTVDAIAGELGLNHRLERFPSQLSGGEKQRVALGRAIVVGPKLLLCDEPFSALDEITRWELRGLLLRLQSHYRTTLFFITHSVEEAVVLGDRILVASGPPLRIVEDLVVNFDQPRNKELLHTPEFTAMHWRVSRALWANVQPQHATKER